MQISEERVDLRASAVRAARGKSGVACTCVLGHAWSARHGGTLEIHCCHVVLSGREQYEL